MEWVKLVNVKIYWKIDKLAELRTLVNCFKIFKKVIKTLRSERCQRKNFNREDHGTDLQAGQAAHR